VVLYRQVGCDMLLEHLEQISINDDRQEPGDRMWAVVF
jgi:hypothetical protein